VGVGANREGFKKPPPPHPPPTHPTNKQKPKAPPPPPPPPPPPTTPKTPHPPTKNQFAIKEKENLQVLRDLCVDWGREGKTQGGRHVGGNEGNGWGGPPPKPTGTWTVKKQARGGGGSRGRVRSGGKEKRTPGSQEGGSCGRCKNPPKQDFRVEEKRGGGRVRGKRGSGTGWTA